jgi:hypothetical protein
LKPIAAITVLLVVGASLSATGCLVQQQQSQSNAAPLVPSSGDSSNADTIFCNNTTLQAFVNSVYFELVNKYGNSSDTMKLNNSSRLNAATWGFSGDYLVMKPASGFYAYCNTAYGTCRAVIDTYSIKDPKNFQSSGNLTVFYLISSTETVGVYVPNGGFAKETSYYIFINKYPEKRLIGTYYLVSPSVPKTTKGGSGSHVYANYSSWIKSHHYD